MRRVPFLLVSATVLALWAASAAVYPDLPARIPVHFDFAGHANRWAPRSFGSWFVIPLIASAVAVFALGLAHYLPRIPPELISLPHKDQFLKLSADRRAGVLGIVQDTLVWIAFCIVVLCAVLQVAVYQSANGHDVAAILRVVEFGPILAISMLLVQMWFSVPRAIEANRDL